ncbi:metallophosphoesterase family protein [Vibrio parahaemolyticus]|uniref:metallophosphoesterase family protein n=1 Tax=Vibrio parahaemolyticus TaxID=670 RepID=UPI00235F69AF|nr:metallophosphoesterase [Vibrio parahaemolyticus]ELU8564823.1 metallophosphoesterase [Vibrio parahaemolyticus]
MSIKSSIIPCLVFGLSPSLSYGGVTQSGNQFSMAVISDPQFFWTENYSADESDHDRLAVQFNNFVPNVINKIVAEGSNNWKGVVINGDLTAFGHGNELNAYEDFIDNFSLTQFPGLGNHDYENNVNDCADNGCASDMLLYLTRNIPKDELKRFDYIKLENPGLGRDVHRGSLAYSWRFGDIHMVQLNNHPYYEANWESSYGGNRGIMRVKNAINWLKDDLSRAIHDEKARTIILNMHQLPPGAILDKEFINILRDYPITAIFYGHSHYVGRRDFYGVPAYNTGASFKADFTLMHFTGFDMRVQMYDADSLYRGNIIESTEDYPTPAQYVENYRIMNTWDVPNYRRPEVIFYRNSSTDLENTSCYIEVSEKVQEIDATQNSECFNDDADSVELRNVKAGTVIKVYDSPSGSMEDDYTIIHVTEDITTTKLIDLEKDRVWNNLIMSHFHNNGLNGKVSRIEVHPPGSYTLEPLITFYEGNGGSQNIVCTIPGNKSQEVNFKNDSYGCDNDEARSVVLSSMHAGTVIEVTDDPNGGHHDDYAVIHVKKDLLGSYTVDTFERSDMHNEQVTVYYYSTGDNKLDGKVSRAKIKVPQSD